MTFGFRLGGSSGISQVDDTFANLGFIAKGSVVLNQTHMTNIANMSMIGSFTVTGRDTPIFAFRSSVPVTVKSVQASGGNWTVTLAYDGITHGAGGTTVDWYLFDRPPTPPSHYGIRVRDASGREVFNSGSKYFRPKLVAATPPGQPTGNGSGLSNSYDIGGLPGGTYAVVLVGTIRTVFPSFVTFADSGTSSYFITNFIFNDGAMPLSTGVRVQSICVDEGTTYFDSFDSSVPYSGGLQTGTGYIVVIDVGGY